MAPVIMGSSAARTRLPAGFETFILHGLVCHRAYARLGRSTVDHISQLDEALPGGLSVMRLRCLSLVAAVAAVPGDFAAGSGPALRAQAQESVFSPDGKTIAFL